MDQKTDKQMKNGQMDGKRTNGRKIDKWTKNRQMDGKQTNGRKIDKWTVKPGGEKQLLETAG